MEICAAAERATGPGSFHGAQQIHGLWRLYPKTREARVEILIKGIRLRETSLQVQNTNPFVLRARTGEEKPTTKVYIDNIPISVADTEIEYSLGQIGCELRSSIVMERARDADNRLTRFITGRRFVFITIPSEPLGKFLKVSVFTATVYHKEQKTHDRPTTCSRCLETGHHVSSCTSDVVCRECGLQGHTRGDPQCAFRKSNQEKEQNSQQTQEGQQTLIESSTSSDHKLPAAESAESTQDLAEKKRPTAVQASLTSSLQLVAHSRSPTPKRGRSRERRSHSPRGRGHKTKHPRRDVEASTSPAQETEDNANVRTVSADRRKDT